MVGGRNLDGDFRTTVRQTHFELLTMKDLYATVRIDRALDDRYDDPMLRRQAGDQGTGGERLILRRGNRFKNFANLALLLGRLAGKWQHVGGVEYDGLITDDIDGRRIQRIRRSPIAAPIERNQKAVESKLHPREPRGTVGCVRRALLRGGQATAPVSDELIAS